MIIDDDYVSLKLARELQKIGYNGITESFYYGSKLRTHVEPCAHNVDNLEAITAAAKMKANK